MSNTQEQANILRQEAETISTLLAHGFDKEKVVTAVTAGDLSKLIGPGEAT